MIKFLTALAIAPAILCAGCSPRTPTGKGADPNAGFDAQIPAWRADIEAKHPACAAKVDGKGCDSFEVRCKGAMVVTSEEAARGVTARVVSAMTFSGRNADGSSGKAGSAFADFRKVDGAWTRAESPPLNLTTCAAQTQTGSVGG